MIQFFLAAGAAAAAVKGAQKLYRAYKTYKAAKGINENANDLIKEWKEKVDSARKEADSKLKEYGQYKMDTWTGPIKDFAETFGRIHNIDFTDRTDFGEFKSFADTGEAIQDFKNKSIKFKELAMGLTGSGAAGGLTALGAYSAVGVLGTASTGTAIGTLSGAAATNATLAWLGGGSIAAGGFGIAGGTAVLGVLVAGPALLVLGFTMDNKAQKNLEEAMTNRAKAEEIEEKLKTVVNLCNKITELTKQFNGTAHKLVDDSLKPFTEHMKFIIKEHGTDFRSYPEVCKETVEMAFKTALTLRDLMDVAILNEDGSITDNAKEKAKNFNDSSEG